MKTHGMDGTRLNFESWMVRNHTLKMHLKTVFITFRKTSESWNPAVSWKVPPMQTETLIPYKILFVHTKSQSFSFRSTETTNCDKGECHPLWLVRSQSWHNIPAEGWRKDRSKNVTHVQHCRSKREASRLSARCSTGHQHHTATTNTPLLHCDCGWHISEANPSPSHKLLTGSVLRLKPTPESRELVSFSSLTPVLFTHTV